MTDGRGADVAVDAVGMEADKDFLIGHLVLYD